MHRPLSARQERFVHEYLLDHNASAAARRAGYSGKTRGSQACILMRNPLVQERIALATADRYAELKINGFDILKARAREAFFDPGVLLDGDSRPIPLHQLSAETRTVLSLSYDMKGNVRVRQAPRHSALAALEKRYLEMLRLQTAVFGHDQAPDEAEAPRRPARVPAPRGPLEGFRLAPDWNEPPPEMPAAVGDAAPVDAVALAAAQIARAEAAEKTLAQPGIAGAPPAAAEKTKAAPAAPEPIEAPAIDPDAPPSPYEPGYDFKKDPNAAYGGRFKAWNLYQEKKRQAEQQALEATAAGLAPNQRIGPGKRVMPRMEPGYNPPWLRDNRPRFAIGAGEFYFSGEEPD